MHQTIENIMVYDVSDNMNKYVLNSILIEATFILKLTGKRMRCSLFETFVKISHNCTILNK